MNPSTNCILVPVDFSDKAVFGLEYACFLAHSFNADLVLLHVIKGVDPVWEVFTQEEQKNYINRIKEHLKRVAADFLHGKKVKVIPMVEKGRLCDTILKISEKLHARFIVMGTSTADNIKKRIIGTNALRIVSEATCPVITLKQPCKTGKINSIVLPLDLSKETKEKVVYAVDMAKIFNSAIQIVSMVTIDDDSIMRRLKSQLSQVMKFIKQHGIECDGEIVKCSNPTDGLIDYIHSHNSDMVVITTHQQVEIVKYFIGSFAATVMHSANIPVMSIVPKLRYNLIFNLPGTH